MPAGFAAIGGAVLGSLGAAGAGAALTIATGVITSAVVGAAIGGISAAIMGGDIGKGMLFGAVGGVITGGLAGGMIAPQTYGMQQTLGSLATPSLSSGGLQAAGQGALYDVATQEVFSATATQSKAGLFGNVLKAPAKDGFMSKMFEGSGGAVLTAAGGLFKKTPYDPNRDPDFLRENREDTQAHDKEMSKLRASLSGGGGGGGSDVPYMELERLKQKGALDQIAAEASENRKSLEIQGKQKLTQMDKDYKLANQNAQAEWDRGMEKLYDAAGAAGGQEYQSGEGAYEAVLAAQEGRGDTQPSRGALMGYPTGPVPDAAMGGAAIPATGQTYVPHAKPSY